MDVAGYAILLLGLVLIGAGAALCCERKFGWEPLAHIGAYLQGLAAIVAVVIGLIKGQEVLEKISDLRKALGEVRQIVGEMHTAIIEKREIPPLNETKRDAQSANPGKLEKDLLEKYWNKQLADIPEAKTEGNLIYMPEKAKVIEKLVKTGGTPKGQLFKAITLKSAIRTNDDQQPEGSTVFADVLTTKDGGFRIDVKRAVLP